MSNYTQLTAARTVSGSIKEWCNHSNIPIDDILDEAEAFIYGKLRCREMLVNTSGTATASATTLSVPTRFRAPLLFRWFGTDARQVCILKRLDWLEERIVLNGDGVIAEGLPQFYGMDASNLIFDVSAYKDLPFQFRYFEALVGLSTDTETNFLTDRFPRLLRAVCMAFGFEHTKNDDQKNYWMGVSEKQIFEANQEYDEEMTGGELEMEIPGATGDF